MERLLPFLARTPPCSNPAGKLEQLSAQGDAPPALQDLQGALHGVAVPRDQTVQLHGILAESTGFGAGTPLPPRLGAEVEEQPVDDRGEECPQAAPAPETAEDPMFALHHL